MLSRNIGKKWPPDGEYILLKKMRDRYIRQTILPEIGLRGQDILSKSSILIAGAGGLGSASALYLAAAGIGRLLIADADTVDSSNLNRQILHSEQTLGMKKTDSALQRLTELNSQIEVVPVNEHLDHNNIDSWLKDVDLIIDACDSYQTRVVLNRASQRFRLPWVYGGIKGFDGLVSTFCPGETPCFECIFRHPPDAEPGPIGVLGAAAGIIASIQAMEAIKLLLSIGTPLKSRMMKISGLTMKIDTLTFPGNLVCPVCQAAEEHKIKEAL